MQDKYTCLSAEHFALISSRYAAFQEALNDLNKEPVRVFDPLSKKSMDEIYLIREVSKDLQMKKEEDIQRAAQAAAEDKAVPETKPEETPEGEEKKPETEK